jgi:hypothetical protein
MFDTDTPSIAAGDRPYYLALLRARTHEYTLSRAAGTSANVGFWIYSRAHS